MRLHVREAVCSSNGGWLKTATSLSPRKLAISSQISAVNSAGESFWGQSCPGWTAAIEDRTRKNPQPPFGGLGRFSVNLDKASVVDRRAFELTTVDVELDEIHTELAGAGDASHESSGELVRERVE